MRAALRATGRSALEQARRRLWLERMRRQVHPERFASFGEGSIIVPPAIVNCPHRIHIGRGVTIHERCWFSVYDHYQGRDHDPWLRIGDRVLLHRDTYISCVGQIDIEDDVISGPNVLISDSYHEYENPHLTIREQPMAEPKAVRVCKGSLIGANALITMGVTVGEHTFIGAGAVVTRDLPPFSVAVGNPARVVRRYDHERACWVDVDRD